MSNCPILIISLSYILMILSISSFLSKRRNADVEFSRKFVHIFVGNWILFVPFFSELWAVLLIPFAFIIINALSFKYRWISSIEREDDSLGTVYYAIALFVLSGLGFALDRMILPLVGVLTMAYADGLAALVGKTWGKSKPFAFAPEKTLLGTLVVMGVSFVIALGVMQCFNRAEGRYDTVWPMLLIASCNALLAALIELTGKKGTDNLSLPIGTGSFVMLCFYHGSLGLWIYLLLSAGILLGAYRLKAISEDGIVAAILTAVTLYTLGGQWIGASLLIFFLLGSAVSKVKNEHKRSAEQLQESGSRRNWKQVLCNSLPASVLLWLGLFYPNAGVLKLLSFAVFSAAAADTFSSELGMLFKGKVVHILTGKAVPSGVSGGVSLAGFLAGLLGSALLSLLAIPELGAEGFFIATGLGFSGTIVDSLLGATLQRKYLGADGQLQDKKTGLSESPAEGLRFVSNNTVNLASLSIVALLGSALLIK